MDIKFVNPGFQYMLDSIMEFQKDDSSVFWNDSLFYFFKELDKDYAYSMPVEKRKDYFKAKLFEIYEVNETLLEEKVQAYSEHWNLHKGNITQAFSDAFGVDCSEMFNDLVCNISLNPVSPRYLKEHSFDVFYLNSERGALGNVLHEMVHFVWFAVWNNLFNDLYEEYENPSLKWILSELVVEAVMSDERLYSVNPYYPREQGGCIYPYFFTMEIEGAPITDMVREMYRTMKISEFMQESYAYCQKHEAEIREHILRSENGGVDK